MAEPSFLVLGSTPQRTDTRWFQLARINGGIVGGGGGSGGAGIVGVVNPEGIVTASPGTPYLNTALQTFWMKNSGAGNTGWGSQLV
jgi:hypothetical protein